MKEEILTLEINEERIHLDKHFLILPFIYRKPIKESISPRLTYSFLNKSLEEIKKEYGNNVAQQIYSDLIISKKDSTKPQEIKEKIPKSICMVDFKILYKELKNNDLKCKIYLYDKLKRYADKFIFNLYFSKKVVLNVNFILKRKIIEWLEVPFN